MMDEEQIGTLVRRAQNGCRESFGQLVSQFEPTVFGTVLQRLRNRAEAVEVSQEVFMQAMRKLPQLREPERFAGWLRQIAVRMSINRAVRRPPETAHGSETFQSLKSDPRTPLDDLIKSEASRHVWGGIEKLRDLDRRTLIAFYFEGQSLKEMSDRFDSPVGTIKRRLHTARNRLKAELHEYQPA
jgi:RNA polymerase sigma-70 factor (ECF subfamily)